MTSKQTAFLACGMALIVLGLLTLSSTATRADLVVRIASITVMFFGMVMAIGGSSER